jgi:hypothetical protein
MTSLHTLSKTTPDASPKDETPEVSLFDNLDAHTAALAIIALGVTVFLLQFMQALIAPLAFGLLPAA